MTLPGAARAVLTAALVVLGLHVVAILYAGAEGRRPFGPVILFLAVALLLQAVDVATSPSPARRRRAVVVAVFLGCLAVYLANGRTIGSGDTLPARYLPLSILRQGNLDLDEFPFLTESGRFRESWFVQTVRDHVVSEYPVGVALLATPFYVPTAIGPAPADSRIVEDLEKLAAATIVALSAALVLLTLRRLASPLDALAITAVYALGTSSLSESSQALWQHGAGQLSLAAALYALTRGRDEPRWVALAGLPLGFAVISRPTNAILALGLGLLVVVHHRRQLAGFALAGAIPVAFQLWYNVAYFGDPLHVQFFSNAVTALQSLPRGRGAWSTPLGTGLTGLLLSPSRGLLVYSPVVLLSFLGLALAWARRGDRLLRYAGPGVLLTLLVYGKWGNWWGGTTYGPRLLADLLPVLALALYPAAPLTSRSLARRAVFIVLAAWSISAHAVGAFADDRSWNTNGNLDVDHFNDRLWSWRDNQLVNPLHDGLVRASIVARGVPTSRAAPALVSASYQTESPTSLAVTCASALDVRVRATNVGRAAWLAHDGERGTIRLGWRWRAGDRPASIAEGRVDLETSVVPGGTHVFRAAIMPPPAAGAYVLEMGLVNEGLEGFTGRGEPPIRMTVTVTTAPELPEWTEPSRAGPPEDVGHPGADVPRVAVVTERPQYRQGDVVHVTVRGRVAERSRPIDVYLLLRGPRGARWFHDGGGLKAAGVCRWIPLATAIRMNPGRDARARFEAATPRMRPGLYAWGLLVTDADTHRIVAAARTNFELTSASRP